MEKLCEFCMASRPVVYCQADAAHLCLSCDAKVHSANVLFHRHLRTLLCNSCQYSPAYTHCLDHRMYICHNCDRRLHNSPSEHRKCVLDSYIGCPSANELAVMWSVDLSELGGNARIDSLTSTSDCIDFGSMTSVSSTSSFTDSVCQREFEMGSKNQQSTKISHKGRQPQSSCLILQQILDLRSLQPSDKKDSSRLACSQEKNAVSESCFTADGNGEDTNCDKQKRLNFSTSRKGCRELQDLKLVEMCPSPFSQLENLPSSSTTCTSLQGENFWQCKSLQTSQFWTQNMEDIGSCEEFFHGNDLDIPDIDVTFHNFEEVFQEEEDSRRELLGEEMSSFANIDTSFFETDDVHANVMEAASRESLVFLGDATTRDNALSLSSEVKMNNGSAELLRSIRPSYSTTSLSLSRFSSKSTGNDSLIDSGFSPSNAGGDRAGKLPRDDILQPQVKNNNDKMDSSLRHEKRAHHASRRGKADAQKCVKGKLSRLQGYNLDNSSVARSC